MQTIATLSPNVRLVVFQFLMKAEQVPTRIPHKRESTASFTPPTKGIEVLRSMPRLDLYLMTCGIEGIEYELVDAWQKPHETDWTKTFVRFVFCHKNHVRSDELFPEFVANREYLRHCLRVLTDRYLWATQAHLNQYFEPDGTLSGHEVLMIGCAKRTPNSEVFSGGRDAENRGIGPKVPLAKLSESLTMRGNEVVLFPPQPILPEPASSAASAS